MDDPTPPDARRPTSKNHFGAGGPIALLIIAGVLIGGLLGQPSIGFLAGLGLGGLIALLLWWRTR